MPWIKYRKEYEKKKKERIEWSQVSQKERRQGTEPTSTKPTLNLTDQNPEKNHKGGKNKESNLTEEGKINGNKEKEKKKGEIDNTTKEIHSTTKEIDGSKMKKKEKEEEFQLNSWPGSRIPTEHTIATTKFYTKTPHLQLTHTDSPTQTHTNSPFSKNNSKINLNIKQNLPKNKANSPTHSLTHSLNSNIHKIGKSTYAIGDVNITKTQIQVLDKGLGFVPNITPLEIEKERKEIEEKVERIIDKTINQTLGLKRTAKRSEKYALTREISKETEEIMKEKRTERNVTQAEIQAIKQLKTKSLTIKPIDKNLGVAVIDTQVYIKEIEKQLENPNNYKKLNSNPTLATIKKIKSLILNLNKEKKLNKKLVKRLQPSKEAKAGRFYGLPKIHKPKLGWRPIVSNNEHPTENLSKWIHSVLEPTARKNYTHIDNSYELCNILAALNKEPTQKTQWIVLTADIENLYSNIPHREGTESCIQAIYEDNENKLKLKNRQAMQALIYNTLSNNVFEFNTKYYTQTKGTAMGTSMAPAYANLYLNQKEQEWLKITKLKHNIVLFKRYLDDIVIIYNNHDDSLQSLTKEIQEAYKPLCITYTYGKKEPFLDVEIEIRRNRIEYNMYRKALNSKEIIPYNSCHPQSTKIGTIIGEYKRINKLNSTEIEKRREKIKLQQRCLKQGYPSKEIEKARRKAQVEKERTQEKEKVHLILTYDERTKKVTERIREEIEKARQKQEEKEEKSIAKIKLVTAFKTQPNLKKILTHARVRHDDQTDRIAATSPGCSTDRNTEPPYPGSPCNIVRPQRSGPNGTSKTNSTLR